MSQFKRNPEVDRVAELRMAGRTFGQIAAQMGISRETARAKYRSWQQRSENKGIVEREKALKEEVARKEAEEEAKALRRIKADARKDVPVDMTEIQELFKLPDYDDIKDSDELKAATLERTAFETLLRTPIDAFNRAHLSQIGSFAGSLLDRSRLYRGEATSIIRHEHRMELIETAKALSEEMERRGITIEGEVVD